ncbi:MAG: nitroreductase family protein [Flavobacteriaceae bacterium]
MNHKTVSEALDHRRSIRIYDNNQPLDTSKVVSCIRNATLAPNSSNMQLWEFYHIENKETIAAVAATCFNQPAARTADQLVVFVVRKDLWKQRVQANIDYLNSAFEKEKNRDSKREKMALNYYQKTMPMLYGTTNKIVGFIKYLSVQFMGLKKPAYRQIKLEDLRVVAHKSTALAAQTFMLSMAEIGYDTCPMEGFDSLRLKKVLKLPAQSEINMVVSCGIRKQEGVYGDRFRVPFETVYHKI